MKIINYLPHGLTVFMVAFLLIESGQKHLGWGYAIASSVIWTFVLLNED